MLGCSVFLGGGLDPPTGLWRLFLGSLTLSPCPCLWLQPYPKFVPAQIVCNPAPPPVHPRVGGSPLPCSQLSGGPCEGGSAPTELLHPQGGCTRELGGLCACKAPCVCTHFSGGVGVHSFVSTCTLVCMRRSVQPCACTCASVCICTSVQVFMHLCRICLLTRVCARVCMPFARLSVHTRVHECVCACTRGCNREWVHMGGCSQVEITSRGISCA